MVEDVESGTERSIDGVMRIYYGGYWVKVYRAPEDTLATKKRLIEALTHRLFNHVEHGLNIPGTRLDEARRAYDSEGDPSRRRVKAGMLAGALFNRAADVFTKLVELQALGVEIGPDNPLMLECGGYLEEALELGKMVLHRTGEEGIDELWGEPFKAFAFPIEEFYRSRYVKIAMTMRAIDWVSSEITTTLAGEEGFEGVGSTVLAFAEAAKVKCETLRTDPEIFDVWASFTVSAERVSAFRPALPADAGAAVERRAAQGLALLRAGKELIFSMARARVPMPKSSCELVDRCERHRMSNMSSGERPPRSRSGIEQREVVEPAEGVA